MLIFKVDARTYCGALWFVGVILSALNNLSQNLFLQTEREGQVRQLILLVDASVSSEAKILSPGNLNYRAEIAPRL